MQDPKKVPQPDSPTVVDRDWQDQTSWDREDINRNPGQDDWNPEGKSRTYGNYYDNQDDEDINRNQGDTDWNEDEPDRIPEHEEDWDQDEPSRNQSNPSGDKEDPRPGEKPLRRENEMPVRRTNEHDFERDDPEPDSNKISDDVGNEGGGR